MREVTFFWKRAHANVLFAGPMTDVFDSVHFISYARRVPKDIRLILKVHFKPGKGINNLEALDFFTLLEVLMEPENEEEGTLILVRVNHPVANLSARTNGTSAVPGACFLDGEGITYTIQGPPLKLRLLSGFLRMVASPDRTSARTVKYTMNDDNGALSQKQIQLAKFAYDRGYFDTPKKIRIAELSEELNLARATISEHMARIESAIMDDMFSSFSDVYIAPETLREILQLVAADQEELEGRNSDGFSKLMAQIRGSIEEEMTTNELHQVDKDVDLESLIQQSMLLHKENLSFIDERLTNENHQLDQH